MSNTDDTPQSARQISVAHVLALFTVNPAKRYLYFAQRNYLMTDREKFDLSPASMRYLDQLIKEQTDHSWPDTSHGVVMMARFLHQDAQRNEVIIEAFTTKEADIQTAPSNIIDEVHEKNVTILNRANVEKPTLTLGWLNKIIFRKEGQSSGQGMLEIDLPSS